MCHACVITSTYILWYPLQSFISVGSNHRKHTARDLKYITCSVLSACCLLLSGGRILIKSNYHVNKHEGTILRRVSGKSVQWRRVVCCVELFGKCHRLTNASPSLIQNGCYSVSNDLLFYQ